MIKKPVWDNPDSHEAGEKFWITKTVMGIVSIRKNMDTQLWKLNADFILDPPDDPEFDQNQQVNKFGGLVYPSADPETLKTLIDDLHVVQIQKFVEAPAAVSDA